MSNGAIISGAIMKGVLFRGSETLGSVGKRLFEYDHRFSETPIEFMGRDRLGTWSSLAALGGTLSQPVTGRKLFKYTDGPNGYGFKNADGFQAYQALGNRYPEIDMFHKGVSPWIFSSVFYWKKTDASTSGATSLLRTGLLAGVTISISHNQPRVQLQPRGSNSTLFTIATPANSLPDDQVSIVTVMFYGDSSSNNYRIIINNANYNFTQNPTYDSGPCEYLRFGLPVTILNDFLIKKNIAYDGTGKTRTQMDAMLADYYRVLKLDSDYSTLITP